MKIDRKRWKSSDDKKPAWNRAKVSIGVTGPALSSLSIHTPKYIKSTKIYENRWKSYKSMKINRKLWKSSDDKKPAWNRAKVSIGAAGPILSYHLRFSPLVWAMLAGNARCQNARRSPMYVLLVRFVVGHVLVVPCKLRRVITMGM